jgi:hypothetical protein
MNRGDSPDAFFFRADRAECLVIARVVRRCLGRSTGHVSGGLSNAPGVAQVCQRDTNEAIARAEEAPFATSGCGRTPTPHRPRAPAMHSAVPEVMA